MILMLGTFPPPTHGMAVNHQALYELMVNRGLSVERLNTSPTTLKRDLFSRLSRWNGMLHAWARLLAARRGQDELYMAPSGRWGQLYDLVSLTIARSKNLRCFLHHHNFAYLEKRRPLAALLFRVAGPDAVHVALCSEMERALRALYGVRNVMILSNVLFLNARGEGRSEVRLRTVGLLSNLTKEKGTEKVIELAQAIRSRGLPLHVIVAGPCVDPPVLEKLRSAVSAGLLEWRGPVYGEDKAAFWRDIDVFVFPTETEAEPNVVWESLVGGVPVLAYRRGCIEGQVGSAGVVIAPQEDFVATAMIWLEKWISCTDEFRRLVDEAVSRYPGVRARALQQWEGLLDAVSAAEVKG